MLTCLPAPASSFHTGQSPDGELIAATEHVNSASRRLRERQEGAFVRGPDRVELLDAADDLPGRAPLQTLLAIRYRSDVNAADWVTRPAGVLALFHLDTNAKFRRIIALERVGIARQLGCPVVLPHP